jgi:xylose isomerase
MKHFDSHAYRTADRADVIEFARGSMRTYKVLEQKVHQFNSDERIQSLLRTINRGSSRVEKLTKKFSGKGAQALLDIEFDRQELASRSLPYEELDQRVFDLLMGAA